MEILLDALISLLSCIGIWTLGRMMLSRLLGDADSRETYYDIPGNTERWTKEANAWTKQKSTRK